MTERKMDLCYTPFYNIEDSYLKVTFQNARSLHLHYKDLSSDHNLQTCHIVSVAESRLTNSDSSDQYCLSGYKIYRNDQEQVCANRPPHGLVTYVRNDVSVRYCAHYSSKDFESTVLQFNLKESKDTVLFVSVYRAPGTSKPLLQNKFSEMCNELKTREARYAIILGDFNIDALDDANSQDIEQMEMVSGCKQKVNEPTTKSLSALDLVFSNIQDEKLWTVSSTWSDHYMLCTSAQLI